MDNQKLITFKNVIDDKFPSLFKKISFNEISTILILQIKGGDVHPNNRHPNIKGKKTQIDITASMKLPPEQSPVCALVTRS